MLRPGGVRKAVVVGAGPAGAACAISLARLGFTVDVIEVRHCVGSSVSDLILYKRRPQVPAAGLEC